MTNAVRFSILHELIKEGKLKRYYLEHDGLRYRVHLLMESAAKILTHNDLDTALEKAIAFVNTGSERRKRKRRIYSRRSTGWGGRRSGIIRRKIDRSHIPNNEQGEN